jgi:hypothetical protein
MTKGPIVAVEYPPLFERETVDGVKVVKDTVFESPLSKLHGRLVPIHGIRTLTLEDESTVFGCRDCEFTEDGPGKIRAHRRALHGFSEEGTTPKPPRREGGAGQIRMPGPDALGLTVYELIDQASMVETYALAQEALDNENQRLHEKIQDLKQEHRTEISDLRRGLRAEVAEAKSAQKAAEKELAGMKARLSKMLGVEDN